MAASRSGAMARYFFELNECGALFPDEEGREVSDLATVKAEAIKAARQLMAAELQDGKLCLSCRIEVLDEDRHTVLIVPFKDAVAVSGI